MAIKRTKDFKKKCLELANRVMQLARDVKYANLHQLESTPTTGSERETKLKEAYELLLTVRYKLTQID